MGVCYAMLSQPDAAEDALLKALRIETAILPKGHYSISMSETISIKITAVVNDQHLFLFLQLRVD